MGHPAPVLTDYRDFYWAGLPKHALTTHPKPLKSLLMVMLDLKAQPPTHHLPWSRDRQENLPCAPGLHDPRLLASNHHVSCP